jgi:hypothetical protein
VLANPKSAFGLRISSQSDGRWHRTVFAAFAALAVCVCRTARAYLSSFAGAAADMPSEDSHRPRHGLRRFAMRKRHAFVGGATVMAAILCVSMASAGNHGRGIAILPPIESPDMDRDGLHPWWPHHYGLFVPYYGSPLTPICTRWRPIAYVPYYCGYCRPHVRYATAPYGDAGMLPPPGIVPEGDPALTSYGPYTGAPRDEKVLLHLGGNGPYTPSHPGAIDIIDAMGGAHPPEAITPP